MKIFKQHPHGSYLATNVASSINGADAKTTPHNDDVVGLVDSEASNVLKKLSWTNIKATLKTYFDNYYEQSSNKKTDLTDNSDTYYPSQKAVKTAVDAKQDSLTWDGDYKAYLIEH